jgi:hypothetical protein
VAFDGPAIAPNPSAAQVPRANENLFINHPWHPIASCSSKDLDAIRLIGWCPPPCGKKACLQSMLARSIPGGAFASFVFVQVITGRERHLSLDGKRVRLPCIKESFPLSFQLVRETSDPSTADQVCSELILQIRSQLPGGYRRNEIVAGILQRLD